MEVPWSAALPRQQLLQIAALKQVTSQLFLASLVDTNPLYLVYKPGLPEASTVFLTCVIILPRWKFQGLQHLHDSNIFT